MDVIIRPEYPVSKDLKNCWHPLLMIRESCDGSTYLEEGYLATRKQDEVVVLRTLAKTSDPITDVARRLGGDWHILTIKEIWPPIKLNGYGKDSDKSGDDGR